MKIGKVSTLRRNCQMGINFQLLSR